MVDFSDLPAPVPEILRKFVDKVTKLDGVYILGIYLTGSISLHDFFPSKSDIDFLVLCERLPDARAAKKIAVMHRSISKDFKRPPLSGAYVDRTVIEREHADAALVYHEGRCGYAPFEMRQVTLAELKSHAITIFSVKPVSLHLDKEDLIDFLFENINNYWRNWIDRHSSFFRRRLLLILFPRLTEWSVLGVARQIYSLETGDITSKTKAGSFCQTALPDEFREIIRTAICVRQNTKTYPRLGSYGINISFARATQTIKCVNCMISLFNERYRQKKKVK